jgi:predicted ATP-dependent endonuclease of OLD family
MVCTHSPYFVSGQGFEHVRLVRKDAKTSRASVAHLTFRELGDIIAKVKDEAPPKAEEGVLAKIHQALQPSLNEIFFTNRLVLVEGLEDVAYITAYMNLLGYDEDFRRHGCHIVPANGKSAMIKPLAIAKQLAIPVFAIFDSDGHVQDTGDGRKEKHRKDNVALLRLCGNANPDPFPADHLWQPTAVMWNTEMGKAISADYAPADWERYRNAVSLEYGQVEGLKKNSIFIADILDYAWRDGKRSATLERLCSSILAFAEQKP